MSFLEGIITFISPCILPMFPIYLSYFAGQDGNKSSSKTITNALGFVLGFTIVFVSLGAFAGTVGSALREYKEIVNIVSGSIIILFGLKFIGFIKIPKLDKNIQLPFNPSNLGFFSSVLFGIVFSIGWTPCVGVFLGSALMLAASAGGSIKGIVLLLLYSLGLALPFLISAILMEQLKSTFAFIKKNMAKISFVSGLFLILMGLLIMFDFIGFYMSLFNF